MNSTELNPLIAMRVWYNTGLLSGNIWKVLLAPPEGPFFCPRVLSFDGTKYYLFLRKSSLSPVGLKPTDAGNNIC